MFVIMAAALIKKGGRIVMIAPPSQFMDNDHGKRRCVD